MTYTAEIKTNSSRDVSHTFHAVSEALALREARRCELDVQTRLGDKRSARLTRLIKHDGTPATEIPLY